MENTNIIYNVDGDNRLSTGLHQAVALSTTTDNQKCLENPFFLKSGSVIVFIIPEIILLSSTKKIFKF